MRVLTEEQAQQWCEARGLDVIVSSGRASVRYRTGSARIRLPSKGTCVESVQLATALLMTGVADDAEENFAGVLLWFQDWDIWSETTERVGWRIVQALRGGPRSPSIASAPGQLFEPGDFVDAQAMVAQPLIFQWDAYLIPASGDFVARLSHDEGIEITARTSAQAEELFHRFMRGGWNPTRV